MTKFKLYNGISGILSFGIGPSDTEFQASALDNFSFTSGTVTPVVIDPEGTGGAPEIVYLTAVTGTTGTIIRGREGTAAVSHDAGVKWHISNTSAISNRSLAALDDPAVNGSVLVSDDTEPELSSWRSPSAPGSVLTSEDWLAPGDEGDRLEIVSGIPQWNPAPSPFLPGDVKQSVQTVNHEGWIMFGTSIPNCQSAHPDLWDVCPTSWRSGTTLNLPSMNGRTALGGGTLGATGGSNSVELLVGNLPAHDHDMAHGHGRTGDGGGHDHSNNHDHPSFSAGGGEHPHQGRFLNIHIPASGTNLRVFVPSTEPFSGRAQLQGGDGADGAHPHSINVPNYTGRTGNAPPHDHAIPAHSGRTGSTGSGNPVTTTPAHVRMNWFIHV